MIGWLRGEVVEAGTDGEVVLDVGGVGYRVVPSAAAMTVVRSASGAVALHVHTHVREDALVLYGFASAAERRSFEALLGAHGVGPALALAVISALGPEGLARAVEEEDLGALCSVPGVGRKTAARMVIDLKARLDRAGRATAGGAAGGMPGGSAASGGEVRAALAELGYGPEEIRHALSEVAGEASVEEQLRAALRNLAASR
jgi:Holliday junction DNA helicase RuvA